MALYSNLEKKKKREPMIKFGGEQNHGSEKWNSSRALLLTNPDALKTSCSTWILIQSINKWIMQLVDTQLTGFTTRVELTGSACICVTVMCLNEYAIKGHAVGWGIRFVWGRNHACQLPKLLQIKPWLELAEETKAHNAGPQVASSLL